MLNNTSGLRWSGVVAAFGLVTALASPAFAEDLILKKGTEVKLHFAAPLKSKSAKAGDKVQFKVDEDVQVDGKTVIKEGTTVNGTINKVNKRGRYGVNARIQLDMSPIRTVTGKYAPLGFKTKGSAVGGRTGEAAGASIGAAAILGPLGLAAGYFIPGKEVNAKAGDKMTVEVTKDTAVIL